VASGVSFGKLGLGAKVGAGVLVTLLVAVAYFVVFYGDLSGKIDQAKSAEGRLRSDLADARQLEFTYQKDLAELTDRQQRQGEMKKILPSTTEYPSFLSALQTVANVSGISLTGWKPEPEVRQEFYARVPMQLELNGRYHQVAKFFYGVGQLDRIINMENIKIVDPKAVEGDIVVKVTALATAFRALDNAPADAGKRAGVGGAP